MLPDMETSDHEDEHLTRSSNRKPTSRSSTDLVRLYLQDIGRVPLLQRDEEVQYAQKVQRYMQLLNLRSAAAHANDPVLTPFIELLAIHDHLITQQGCRPSLERWATAAGIEVSALKQTLKIGRKRWADLAQLTVEELEQHQKIGRHAKEMMLKANLRLVVSVAKKYQNRGLELLDLIQEGSLGLERAVDKFDPTKGYRFSTYAYWWIRQGITRAISTQSRTIRLPVHITEKLNKIKKAQRQVAETKGHLANMDDLAQVLKMTPAQIREILSQIPRSISLDIKVGKEQDTDLVDLLENPGASPEDYLTRESLKRDLLDLLQQLTEREREVLLLRFGLNDSHTYSLSEIGRRLGLSRERVRQIECKALKKLRHPNRCNQIRDYLEAFK